MQDSPAENKPGNPIWQATKVVLVDSGATAIVGLILGFFFFLLHIPLAGMVSKVLSMIFGLAISVYMAFYLYRKYSKEMNAFIALMVAGLIGGGIASLVPKTIIDSSFSHDLITIAATLAAYVFGWYAAKMSEVKIFLFGERWMKAFMIIGIVIYCSYIIVTLAGHPLQ